MRMSSSSKVSLLKKALKLCVITVCTTGFLLQTIQFMFLYWTYPTVVDIQVSVPSEIEVPGISFCNSNGINPEVICSLGDFCIGEEMLKEVEFCRFFPFICHPGGELPFDFQAVTYQKFSSSQNFNASVMQMLRKPLKEFFTCDIISSGASRECMTDDAILSSYYSDTNLFNLCFTINSLWSQPDKKILKIKKSDKIRMQFYMDISDRNKSAKPSFSQPPRYNYPSTPSVQLGVHSPYVTTSPFFFGESFIGGKEYKIKLKQSEKHLLPAPYQTNCTNYMNEWVTRGGMGPLNERMVMEECKYNISINTIGCVPFTVDYPHNDSVCKYCDSCHRSLNTYLEDTCGQLQQLYNHPCYFVTYEMDIEEKLVYLLLRLESDTLKLNETMVEKTKGYNCSYENIWTRYCQTVRIEIVFDDFEITNLTYNPKFESVELFSVIGGYMGMYLGVSIVAVYDFGEMIITAVYRFVKIRRGKAMKTKK